MNIMKYPLYQCTRIVRAVKIGWMVELPSEGKISVMPLDDALAPVNLPKHWHERNSPQPGGYVVFYGDGFIGYSPPAVFEQCHTKIPESIDV
jgi:hypothetical protein